MSTYSIDNLLEQIWSINSKIEFKKSLKCVIINKKNSMRIEWILSLILYVK